MKLTVCGSITFYSEMEALKEALEKVGHEVKIPLLSAEVPWFNNSRKVHFNAFVEENGGIEAFPLGHEVWDMKRGAINDHFEKIEWGDGILVANYPKRGVDGYVGGNTLMEIALAFYLKKPIYILHPISSDLSYKVEILGMKPVFLDGDVSRILPKT